jgi:hypothetical protein
MRWDGGIRQAGKDALARLVNEGENAVLDGSEIKYALYELNARYREGPFYGSGGGFGAEIKCTEQGWIAIRSGGSYFRPDEELAAQLDCAEQALEALLKEFNRERDEARAQEDLAGQEAAQDVPE